MNDFDAERHTESVPTRNGIVQAPAKILYTETHDYDLDFPDTERQIVRDYKFLSALLDSTENGIAIAANQGGLNRSMFVHRLYGDYTAVINPMIILPPNARKEQVVAPEGCLSLPQGLFLREGLFRYPEIYVEYIEYPGMAVIHNMKVDGYAAQMWQHECDHLAGYTIAERVEES